MAARERSPVDSPVSPHTMEAGVRGRSHRGPGFAFAGCGSRVEPANIPVPPSRSVSVSSPAALEPVVLGLLQQMHQQQNLIGNLSSQMQQLSLEVQGQRQTQTQVVEQLAQQQSMNVTMSERLAQIQEGMLGLRASLTEARVAPSTDATSPQRRPEHFEIGSDNEGPDAVAARPRVQLQGSLPRSDPLGPLGRAEKWLPALPKPQTASWRTRHEEIVGFRTYLEDLVCWLGLGSDQYPTECYAAVGSEREILQSGLTAEQAARSAKLFSILKNAFSDFGRADLIIRAYVELQGSTLNGYEVLRLLAREFALKSRAEALFFKNQTVNQECKSTHISEIVRMVDVAVCKFAKLVATLPAQERLGVDISEADKTLMLLRSLPSGCRQYVVLHTASDSYEDLRAACVRYEAQNRIWLDPTGNQMINALEAQNDEAEDGGDDAWLYWWDEEYEAFVCALKGKGKQKGKGKGKGKAQGKHLGKAQDASSGAEKSAESSKAARGTCYICHQKGHFADKCPSKNSDVVCFCCNKPGHKSFQCPDNPNKGARVRVSGPLTSFRPEWPVMKGPPCRWPCFCVTQAQRCVQQVRVVCRAWCGC